MLCLPNSCFRSGNSLGRVSMIDGCLSHIISKCLVNLISDTMFWGLPHQGPWGPGILGRLRLSSIFTLHPPQYLHCNPQCPTSDGQTHLKCKQCLKKTCISLFQCKMFRQAWVPNVWPPKDQDLPSLPCPAWCKRQVNEAHCCIRGPIKGKWALNFRPSPRNWRD